MAQKNERWLDQTGLNLIRIVIGSYFMAVSLDLVVGVDQTVMFAPFAPYLLADLVGSTLLFVLSVAFMTGIYLRMTALMLALFVLGSSLIQNFLVAEFENVSDFWRDVTLASAVILNYSNLTRREMRRAALMHRRRTRVRKVPLPGDEIMPRRITPPAQVKRPVQRDIREALHAPVQKPTPKPKPALPLEKPVMDMGDRAFANILN